MRIVTLVVAVTVSGVPDDVDPARLVLEFDHDRVRARALPLTTGPPVDIPSARVVAHETVGTHVE